LRAAVKSTSISFDPSQGAEDGPTSVSFACLKLKEVAQTAELTALQQQRSHLDDNLPSEPPP
jgi:hypothetical protein